jgi:hypothetical protein
VAKITRFCKKSAPYRSGEELLLYPNEKTPGSYAPPGVLFMPVELVETHHSYPQFLQWNCLPGFLLAQPQIATSISFVFYNRGD